LSPEAQLITHCARVDVSDAAQERLTSLLQKDLDWGYLERQIPRHGVEPLVHRALSQYAEFIPDDVLSALGDRSRQTAFHNLQQFHELLRLVRLIENEGVPVIPFKGPMLGALEYGDVSYRRFVDLDIMVRKDDIPRVKELLVEENYEPHRDFNSEEEAEHVEAQLGYEFIHRAKQTVVEVHWTFFYEIYAFDLTPDEVWDRHRTVTLSGVPVRTLATEDLFIYLCTHGTKHRWANLKWIADIAEFTRAHPVLDWSVVARRARRLGCMRMLRLGCYLAYNLLGAPIPTPVVQDAETSRVVRSMGRQVCNDWLFREPDAPKSSELENFLFHLRERERWRDRWPYVLHHISLWFGPK